MFARAAAVIVAATVVGACSSPPQPETITLTFIRHGESQGNTSGFIDSSVPGPALTPLGVEQAKKAADELRNDGFDGVYASTMVRTQQTAAPLAGDLGDQVEVLPGLREIGAGWFEGKPDSMVGSYFAAPMQWLQGDRNAQIPDSVNGNQFNDEFTAAVQKIYDSGDKKPVAFSHGGAIAMWTLMNAINGKDSLLTSHPLPNTARVVVKGSPTSGWTLVDWDGITQFN
jgi:broad specificity phosphatase PhoE